MRTLHVNNLDETGEFGRRVGAALFPGTVVGLVGPLGAGKTQLARAIAEGLGIPNPDVVTSPTFVLIQEYDARLPIYHFDAYRLASEADFADLGAQEYFQGDGVCLVEWVDKVRGVLPQAYLEIRITITGPESRRIELHPHGERYEALAAQLTV
jgi:tRNA threonylcarbamoyladenosine biosynthesis protein TsaE